MPVDRTFATGTEFDAAQGNNEFTYGELYLIDEGLRLCVATGTSEVKFIYGADDSPTFHDIRADGNISAAGSITDHD
jgi:hypothetical protein